MAWICACFPYSGHGDAVFAVPNSNLAADVEKLHSSSQPGVGNESKSFATLLLSFNPPAAGWQTSVHACRPASNKPAQASPIQSRALASYMLQRTSDKDKQESKNTKRRTESTVKMDAPLELRQEQVRKIQLPEIPVESVGNALLGYLDDVTSGQVLLSMLIAGCGNAMTQVLSNGGHIMDIDFIATLSVMVFVQLWSGGIQPKIYAAFNRVFGDDLIKKLAADFFGYAPLVFIPVFYTTTGIFRGLDWSDNVARLSSNFLDTYLAQLVVWPIPMFIYWRWIPQRFGVIYLQVFAFIDKAIQALIEISHR